MIIECKMRYHYQLKEDMYADGIKLHLVRPITTMKC